MKSSFAQRFERLLAVDVIRALIPDHHCPAAVLAFWNYPFKVFVVDRVIFDFDREMFLAFLPRQTFRQRPGFQNALHLQSEIVMQPARVVFMDHKARCTANLFRQWLATFGLGRLGKIAFRLVFLQTHSVQSNRGSGRKKSLEGSTSSSAKPSEELRFGGERFADEITGEPAN